MSDDFFAHPYRRDISPAWRKSWTFPDPVIVFKSEQSEEFSPYEPSLNFGHMNLGESKTITFTVDNQGGPVKGQLYFDWYNKPGEEYRFLEYGAKFSINRIATTDSVFPIEVSVIIKASEVKNWELRNLLVMQVMDTQYRFSVSVQINMPPEPEPEPPPPTDSELLGQQISRMTANQFFAFLESKFVRTQRRKLKGEDLADFIADLKPTAAILKQMTTVQKWEWYGFWRVHSYYNYYGGDSTLKWIGRSWDYRPWLVLLKLLYVIFRPIINLKGDEGEE